MRDLGMSKSYYSILMDQASKVVQVGRENPATLTAASLAVFQMALANTWMVTIGLASVDNEIAGDVEYVVCLVIAAALGGMLGKNIDYTHRSLRQRSTQSYDESSLSCWGSFFANPLNVLSNNRITFCGVLMGGAKAAIENAWMLTVGLPDVESDVVTGLNYVTRILLAAALIGMLGHSVDSARQLSQQNSARNEDEDSVELVTLEGP